MDGFQSCFPQIDISPSMRYNVTQNSCLKRIQKILFKQTMEKTLRAKIYHFLVNRKPGIRQRYHRFHDGTTGMKKVVSWFYLLGLNFCYYVLFCRFLGEQTEIPVYEEKKPPCTESESVLANRDRRSVSETVSFLMQYEVISFDIFDTLIFRPFSEPTDLFFFLGEKLEILDFKRLRMQAEAEARTQKYKEEKHYEITLSDIWSRLENEIGVTKEQGMQMEQALEMEFCYANPFMEQVFTQLREHGKRVVITSDMYLSKAFLSELLQKNGYGGYEELYVSCEYEKSKAEGLLYEVVKRAYPDTDSMIHVGDNPVSDVKNAKKHGFEVFYYPNVNRNALLYRSYDMSAVVGGAYRGIVNNKLYNGTEQLSMEYEYGYIYGGLFVLGYCNFIHTYVRVHGIDKLLFLSRDGDILRQAYAVLFPEEKTEYVYWSRAAATKLMARYNSYDFFRRYLYHKADGTYTLEQILKSMRLEFLLDRLLRQLPNETYLTSGNVRQVKRFLEANWQDVTAVYDRESKAAELYYRKVLGDSRNALAVDIGWAGSGAIALDYLVQKVWKLPCSITGAVAGTNSVHNFEVDASEIFLQNGKLAAYLYAQSFNRDLWKKHDPNTDDNIFFELLLASPTPQFLGFELDEVSGEVLYLFGKMDANPEGMKEIQNGILDFVRDYQKHFSGYPYLFCVSGRDAYAPILAASGNKKAYLKTLKKKFEFEANVL